MSKRLYEEKHPETAHTAANRQIGEQQNASRFTADTAKATGKSERVKCPIIGHPGGSFTVKDSAQMQIPNPFWIPQPAEIAHPWAIWESHAKSPTIAVSGKYVTITHLVCRRSLRLRRSLYGRTSPQEPTSQPSPVGLAYTEEMEAPDGTTRHPRRIP